MSPNPCNIARQQPEQNIEVDVAVIGGGLVGSSIALGLKQKKLDVAVLDENDLSFRASRGNFGLAWIQGKGLGLSRYASWTRQAGELWPEFAQLLHSLSGIDVHYIRPGGFKLALSDDEMQGLLDHMDALHKQEGVEPQPYEVLSHDEVKERIPHIGKDVVGALYSPMDGHLNSLKLFYALHASLKTLGVKYCHDWRANNIEAENGGFKIESENRTVRAGKVILTAGLGNPKLAEMVGLRAPIKPNKGHVIVTEKAAPFLHYPIITVRQTDEGGIMIGESQQERGYDLDLEQPVLTSLAARAVKMFPLIADLNIVRTWSALRIMSPDGFPIYEQSKSCPGAFLATCHSGVTLAPVHAFELATSIASGHIRNDLSPFSVERFNV